MSKTLLLLAAGLAAPLFSPQLDAHLLSFPAEAGTALTPTARRVLTLELSDGEMSMSFDGEENEAEAPEIELVITEEESLVFSDVFSGVADGRASKIKRTFDEIETSSSQHLVNPEGEEMDDETPGSSELTEKTVLFTWDADDESYTCAFDESVEDGDEGLLEELEAIADFTWYLPKDEVEVGDTWEIEVEAFRQTSSLSGELSVVREGDEDDEGDSSRRRTSRSGETQHEKSRTSMVAGEDDRVAALEAKYVVKHLKTGCLSWPSCSGDRMPTVLHLTANSLCAGWNLVASRGSWTSPAHFRLYERLHMD